MKTIYKKLLFLLLLLPFSALAQSTLEGVVLDGKSKQPIPGVNVVIQGTEMGTSTDLDGKFKLSKLNKGDKIVFSFIGYSNATIEFNNQKSLIISLEEESSQLQEVVIQVGYGNVKKKDATGSVTLLTTKDFNRGTNVTAENLLNGRVAGLTVNTSGSPGSGSEIRIRGGASLFAKNDPLIVIDGLPIENNTGTGATSILSSINPSTIESFSILKDASATAIYGSRASNGVIIITTKKGSKKLAVDYNFQYGSGQLVETLDVYSADEFRQLVAQRLPARVTELGTADTNWQKAIYRRTDFVDNSLSIRGNLFNVIPSRLTVGNTYQEGLRLTNYFNRNTASIALNPSLFKDHLKLKLNANYSNERSRFADGVEGTAIRFDPTQSVYDPNSIYGGFFEYYNQGNGELTPQRLRNPVAQLLQTNDRGVNNRFYGNFELDYKLHFFPDLRGIVNVAFDEADGQRNKYVGDDAASSGSNANIPYGTREESSSLRRNKLLDAYFVYKKSIGQLALDLTGGYSYQKFEARRFETGNVNDPNLPGGPTGFPRSSFDTDVVLVGFFARTNLNFKDSYLLTLSYRRDGSSRFAKENRFGNFPAAAFAWKVKNDFFKESKVLSDLKLRVGWGITGQQDIPAANDYLQQYNIGSGSSQYFFGPLATPIAVSNRLSPDLRWEETNTYNVGLDYGFFNNRVTGAVELFYKESKDLLVEAAVSDGSNFANRAWQNVGSFTTKGIEVTVNVDVVKAADFNWSVNLNATTFQRKITDLIYNADIAVGDNIIGTGTQGQIFSEGYSPYSFYLYNQLYDNAGNPVEGAYADLNGDGVLTSADKYIYRNPDPDATFGLASNLNYKNLDFSFNMRASVGNHIFNAFAAKNTQYEQLGAAGGAGLGNLPTSVSNNNFQTTSSVALSDIYVENASFLKLDNVTLGYTFPQWIEGKASLRLFTGVQNAFIITKYSGIDPEITNNGVDNTIYPRQRSFLFGANLKF